jgi:hypothetical protein
MERVKKALFQSNSLPDVSQTFAPNLPTPFPQKTWTQKTKQKRCHKRRDVYPSDLSFIYIGNFFSKTACDSDNVFTYLGYLTAMARIIKNDLKWCSKLWHNLRLSFWWLEVSFMPPELSITFLDSITTYLDLSLKLTYNCHLWSSKYFYNRGHRLHCPR